MEKKLVWIKVTDHQIWPGKICTPRPNTTEASLRPKQPSKWIYFFGTTHYCWVEDSNLMPYLEHRDAIVKTIRGKFLIKAVEQINEYLRDPRKCNFSTFDIPFEVDNEDTDTAFNKLRESEDSPELEQPKPLVSSINKTEKDEDTDTAFNKLHESEDSPELEQPKPLVSSINKTEKESKAKTKRINSNNGDIADTPTKRMRHSTNEETEIDVMSEYDSASRHNDNTGQMLLDSSVVPQELPEISITMSQSLKLQYIDTAAKTFGFLGVGIMGSGIVKNLLNYGHKVIIWNRDPSKARKFEEIGAQVAVTPCDLAEQTDIIFSCVSDASVLETTVFGNAGIFSSKQHFGEKGYVEMTGLDGDTSQCIADAIVSKGGRYLEAQMQGSKIQAEDGTLTILAAGDRTLFDECQSCFRAMAKTSFFLGEVGNSTKLHLTLQLMTGITLGALAEHLALADRAGLQQKDVMEVLEMTTLASQYMIQKSAAIINQDHAPHQPLMYMQKDLRAALSLSEQLDLNMPIAAATHEVFKDAKRFGYSKRDASAVYHFYRQF